MVKANEKIVAFVDILGFTNLIKEFDKGNKQILNDLHTAVHSSIQVLQSSFPSSINNNDKWEAEKYLEVKLFSDCLCIASPSEHSSLNFYLHFRYFYMYLATYQLVLMEKGYQVRGGLTIGSYYSDNLMIFSGGLVEAYQLEKDKAIYPRILVSEKIINKLKPFFLPDNKVSLNRMLLTDRKDNLIFVNPFNNVRVTSPDADIQVQSLINRMGIDGIIDAFEDSDKDLMFKSISQVKFQIEKSRLKNIDNDNVISKLDWLLSLIEFCEKEEETNFKLIYK